jgi:hypothetical protein
MMRMSEGKKNSALELIACHLSVPYGMGSVTAEHLAQALRAGSLSVLSAAPKALRIATWLFIENTPELIVRATYEAGADVSRANRLYEETLKDHMVRVPAWEDSIRYMI